MHKILLIRSKLKRLQTLLKRNEIWKSIRNRDDDAPQYKVVVINQGTRTTVEKQFVQLKDAFNYVYPGCKTMYGHEFYIYKNDQFLVLHPVNQ